MKDFKLTTSAVTVTVRNEWRRGVIGESGKVWPDHVLLDVGVVRNGREEWNCISLTPERARKIAAALLKAAEEATR